MEQGNRGRVTLVLGGARSGKSAFAQQLAQRALPPVTYVATATASDAEMAARIAAHQAARPREWRVVEARTSAAAILQVELSDSRTVLVDSLGMLVSNLLLGEGCQFGETSGGGLKIEAVAQAEVRNLVALARSRGFELIVVSDEVGMSVVPPTALGRAFRDGVGRANQELAAAADAVYLLVAGIPIEVKQLAARRGSS